MSNNNKALKSQSKFLSMILRHKPEEIGIQLDSHGWAYIDELIQKANDTHRNQGHNFSPLTKENILKIVETSDKQRFAISEDGLKIRANQGHSTSTVDLEFKAIEPPEFLYHGTAKKYMESILKQGIMKQSRHYVHLSSTVETALSVGARHGKPIVFKVMAAQMHQEGHKFYLSENGVWLCDFVPSNFLEIFKNKL